MKIIENRKKFYALSLIVILIGLLAMGINAAKGKGFFEQDIEFTGGSYIQFDLGTPLTNDIRKELVNITAEVTGDKNPRITSADETGVIITVQRVDNEKRTALYNAIKEKYNLTAAAPLAHEDFSATISNEIKWGAIKAVVVGVILILIYISFRFKDYKFGVSAVMALVHDVLVMLTVYAVFRIPLNNSFIAAMLTIVGYSINDTIIVFDRIRENKGRKGYKAQQGVPSEVVNDSISQTISRSIWTSVTTLIMVVLLYILGTDQVKEFALPIIVGVGAGTYSSIFIASPLWFDLSNAKKSNK